LREEIRKRKGLDKLSSRPNIKNWTKPIINIDKDSRTPIKSAGKRKENPNTTRKFDQIYLI